MSPSVQRSAPSSVEPIISCCCSGRPVEREEWRGEGGTIGVWEIKDCCGWVKDKERQCKDLCTLDVYLQKNF